jgi:hypothetical protein
MAMCELEALLKYHDTDFKFNHLNNRIRCFPHIINICMSHIIASCTWVSKEYLKSLRSEGDDHLSSFNIGNNNDNDDNDDDDDDNDDNNDDDNNDNNDDDNNDNNDDNDNDDNDNDDNDNDNNDNDDNDNDDNDDNNNDNDDDDNNNSNNTASPQRIRWDNPTFKLKNFNLNGLSTEERAWFSGMKCDPVKRACTVVCILHSSDQRKQDFKEVIKNRNKSEWFRGVDSSVIVVPDLEPLHDVKTRWDFTYAMIEHLVALRPVSIPVVSYFNHGVWVWYPH